MSKPLTITPKTGDAYIHRQSGGKYIVVCIALEEATEKPVVVYRGVETQTTWTRPLEEFMDGRFVSEFGE